MYAMRRLLPAVVVVVWGVYACMWMCIRVYTCMCVSTVRNGESLPQICDRFIHDKRTCDCVPSTHAHTHSLIKQARGGNWTFPRVFSTRRGDSPKRDTLTTALLKTRRRFASRNYVVARFMNKRVIVLNDHCWFT